MMSCYRVLKFQLPAGLRLLGDPILRAIAQPVNRDYIQTSEFKDLTKKMLSMMRECEAVGIAAPQIGKSLQVIAMEFPKEYFPVTPRQLGIFEKEDIEAMEMSVFPPQIIVNPKITKVTDQRITELPEASVSVPLFKGIVPRYYGVQLEGMNENGEEVKRVYRGWPARIVQHKVDHLNGALYIDKMKPETFENIYWKLYWH